MLCTLNMHPQLGSRAPSRAMHSRAGPESHGTHLGLRRDIGAVVQQRPHHRKMPGIGGEVQGGPPVLKSTGAVSGGATATRAASAGGDALPRGSPFTPDTHQRKHCNRFISLNQDSEKTDKEINDMRDLKKV